MATLYEIGEEYRRLCELLESEELSDEEAAELASLFENNSQAESDKADGYRKILGEYVAQEEAINNEIDRLKTRVCVAQRAQERMKDRVKTYLLMTGKDALEGSLGKFRLQNKPASVEIRDAEILPAFYLRIVPEKREPDKAKIKEALKAGEDVPGAALSAPEKTLRVI